MRIKQVKIFFDGGCQPNPGMMEIAVVARGIPYYRHDVGYGTNIDAEWLALLYALEIARSLKLTDIILIGDALTVVNQANGSAPCRRQNLQDHYNAFTQKAADFTRVRIRHIVRTQNLAGIALSIRRNNYA
jgi:ribonuclease HI